MLMASGRACPDGILLSIYCTIYPSMNTSYLCELSKHLHLFLLMRLFFELKEARHRH
jgi:hypothetical protein